MNTKHLKNYAPKARRQFIQAVENRLAWLGIYPNTVAEVSFQGDSALIEGRVFSRKQAEQRNRLIDRIASRGATGGFAMFVREMAYTWFNRLAAIRFMELKGYLEHGYRVLSSKDGSAGLPEILDYAADVADLLQLNKKQMIELQLAGNQQEKLYRELLLGQCHYLHAIMPFMFEALDDATELLLPDNLTKTDSILKGLVEEIPEADWQNIEVIGWLYQFYISEHKDAVIGKVVKSEDIPAATQLFTPNWIVKYLVQNSVGRQWLQTYPDSAIKAQMEYYIGPGEQPAEVIAQLQAHTPASIEPESIKVLDPACGSGHILVEVYELLREIYLERGYRLRDIPQLILTKNIFGLDIDDRAAQLSGFALMMKAREDDRRIFERIKTDHLQLNIFALQQTDKLDINRLWQALNLEGKQQRGSSGDLFGGLDDALPQVAEPTQHGLYHQYFTLLQYLKTAFAQAKTLGSLVQIEHSKLEELQNLQLLLQEKQQGTDPAAKQSAEVLMPIVQQALVLAQLYDAVIANPPYMGSKGMNADLKDFVNKQFPNTKSDLFAVFMERVFGLLKPTGVNAQINMQSWMFLSSYEKWREWLLQHKTIITMAHLGARAFDSISGEVVSTTAFVIVNQAYLQYQGAYFRLVDGKSEAEKRQMLLSSIA